MSIRHYSPRRGRRHGVNPRSQKFLIALLAITILIQIAYPLVHGSTLTAITIATVLFGATTMFTHAVLAYGWRYALTYFAITSIFALIVETIGVHTGWPFGTYRYDTSLGLAIFGVPLVVPMAWVMMAHPILCAARRILKSWIFLYGGATLMAWDFFLDPQMVSAGRWKWQVTGSHLPFAAEIPLSNAFGWLLAGIALIAILNLLLPHERRKDSASLTVISIFLGWTLFSGIVGNIFFFDRPGIAFLGGLTFGLLITPFLFSSSFGRS